MSARILPCIADGYIQNRIFNGKTRSTDANVGLGGTIDIFKLYDEHPISSSMEFTLSGAIELSRGLLKFDLDPIRALTGSVIDLNTNFSCSLLMESVFAGQPVPSNTSLSVHLLSKSFDEGQGFDVVSYNDLDSANFVTASVSAGSASLWNITGSGKSGYLGQKNVDYITGSADFGDLISNQLFKLGIENLNVDVTKLVSASLTQDIDHGFRLSLSSSHETDDKSYFVFRFASRHSTNPAIRPRLYVRWNDAVQDHHEDFQFDLSGSLFLRNYARGRLTNIVSGTALTQITGNNSILLKLESGSTKFFVTGAQHNFGTNLWQSGTYSASFLIPSVKNSTLYTEIQSAGSASFDEIWSSLDESIAYHSASTPFVVKSQVRSFSNSPKRLVLNISNLRSQYSQNEVARFRVQVFDVDEEFKASKFPLERKSLIFPKMYYQLRDANTLDTIIPFDAKGEGDGIDGTLMSVDENGMFFDVWINDLPLGRSYKFDFKIKENNGSEMIFSDLDLKFVVAN